MRGDEPFCDAHPSGHSLSHADPGDTSNLPGDDGFWHPDRIDELADGALHIFWPDGADIRQTRGLAEFLGRLLQCSPRDIPVIHDGFGRPVSAAPPAGAGWPPGARLYLGIAADPGRQFLAVTRDLPVALSVHTVPRGPVGELLLPFTPLERRYVQEAPEDRRAHRLAQLWTRKEAALRLTGRGGLALADEIDALSEARDGKVVIPASPAHPGGIAYVRDLPTGPRTVASAATPAPASGLRTWRL
ncbi:hypothetical protein JCM4914_38680 [Streptomyces platensis subsp. malvinus]